MADTARIKYLWNKAKSPKDFQMQARTFNATPQGFIFGSKLSAERRKQINITISDLRFEGDIEEIVKRWEPKVPQR